MKNFLLNAFSKSYSLVNTRYVNTFIPVTQELSPGKTELTSPEEHKALENLKMTAENLLKMMEKYPTLKLIKETIFIEVLDLDNVKFTVQMQEDKIDIKVGWDLTIKPSFVTPLYQHNLVNLEKSTADGEINLEEAYKITRVLFVPFLRGLYQGDYSHLPHDKSYMKLDNFIQVEVRAENGVEVKEFPGNAKATVVNVDGQWLVFEGFQGDPDVRFSMDIKQAIEFAYLVRIALIQAKPNSSWEELKHVVDKYVDLKNKTTVYERSWHNLEDRPRQ